MKKAELISQTAKATEKYLVETMKIDSRLLNDLKILAKHTWVKNFEPGNLAGNVIDRSIERLGYKIDDDTNIDIFDNAVNNGDLKALKDWIEKTFGQYELYLLDLILWREINFTNK
ncbi:hypothetical protein [Desulfocicer niacini]